MATTQIEVVAGDYFAFNAIGGTYPPGFPETPSVNNPYLELTWNGTNQYRNTILLFRFDTGSVITTGSGVVSATFEITNTSGFVNTDTPSYAGEFYTWTHPTPVSGDHANVIASSVFTPVVLTDFSHGVVKSMPLSGLHNVSTTGYTYLRTMLVDTAAPTGTNFVGFAGHADGSFMGPALTVEYTPRTRIAPDAIVSQTNLTGVVGDIDEDPDSPDGSWLTAP